VPMAERAALDEDAVYIGDLVGCTCSMWLESVAKAIGRIEDVDRTAGPVALLVVTADESSEEILIPFAKSYLRAVGSGTETREMALRGLVGLNSNRA